MSGTLFLILDELEIKAPTFSSNIGVDYQRIYDIQREKTKYISSEVANLITKIYPQYSLFWLTNGIGEPHGKTLLDKVKEYATYKGISTDEFVQYVNIPEYRLELMKSSEMTKNELMRISSNYPDLNVDWLLENHGGMLSVTESTGITSLPAKERKRYEAKIDALTNRYNELNEKYTALLEENRELLKKEIEEGKKIPDRDAPGATFADAK